jgi:beta-glucosidase
MSFSNSFVWGVAAASYQIEGATTVDGRGETVWDMLCRKPGAIWNHHTGAVACDHYRRYREDVTLMKSLGVHAYRLSVAWSRVQPNGTGKVNAKGLAFYDRLVDRLLAAGIQPWVTLFHWDLPLALYHRGGWLNREIADQFADYTKIVVSKLSDRVQHWMTLNEPVCFIDLGMRVGRQAPGDKLAWAEVLQAGHHALLAHGKGTQAIRANAKSKPVVGWAPTGSVGVPATTSRADIAAARKGMFGFAERSIWQHSWWSDPVVFGRYPADGLKMFGSDAPKVNAGDMKTIRQPLDFFGVNIYSGTVYRAGQDGKPQNVPFPVGHPLTAIRWNVLPESLYWGPKFLYERYGKPVVVTENGMSSADVISLDGRVHDPQRIDFLHRYLRELTRAAADGVDVRGYFQWSIMDNFEWAEGYKERFGLVYVDYPTQQRIPKDSAYWYRDVIASNGAHL